MIARIPETEKTESPITRPVREPLKYSGSLDQYKSIDHTPVIGTEFLQVQLADLLSSDIKLRDLAVTVSRRGVVFFRNQELSIDQQKSLAQKLGELTGKPSTSRLYKHAVLNSLAEPVDSSGRMDDEVSIISSDTFKKFKIYPDKKEKLLPLASELWHADATYERVPSDYAVLYMHDLPEDGSGGDTLWASGYEAYDRLSTPMKRFVEGLKTFQTQKNFIDKIAKDNGLMLTDRGAPENNTADLQASHPAVRTNPVTGWKCLYGAGQSIKDGHIEGLTNYESNMMKDYFLQLIAQNHDLQVRFRWGAKDVAIWDNRCVYHSATNDFDGYRRGLRVMSLGEIPYYDPASKSRREALAEESCQIASPWNH